MPGYHIRYTTEVTMEVYVEAPTEEEAITKAIEFDHDEEPQEVDGGGFSREDIISVEENI
jgi:hypothetical protein